MAGECEASNGISLFEIIKTDSIGNVSWDKVYGDTATFSIDCAYTIEETFDGGFIAGGITHSFGLLRLYLVKIDSVGNLQWSKTFGGSNSCKEAFAIQAKDSSYVIIGSLDIGSPYPFHIIKTDNYGNTNCYDSIPPTNVYLMNSVAHDANGIFTSVSGLKKKPPTQVNNIVVPGITLCSNVSISEILENTIEIYPNPTTDNFTIKLNKEMKNGRIEIFNSLACKVYSEIFSGNTITFDSKLSEGIYFVRVTDKRQTLTEKIIIGQ